MRRLGLIGAIKLAILGGLIGVMPATSASAQQLGVVISRDNAGQWPEIEKRLQLLGKAYCIVNGDRWDDKADFERVDILFLPNVTRLSPQQSRALDGWVANGGKVIATGTTGNFSSPSVRTELQTIFGAYWGFANPQPAVLNSLSTDAADATPIRGGTLLTALPTTRTLATWQLSRPEPAIISNGNTTTLMGWRWGLDAIATPEVDVAWLTEVLNQYPALEPAVASSPQNCDSAIAGNGIDISTNNASAVTPTAPILSAPQVVSSNAAPTNLLAQPARIAPREAVSSSVIAAPRTELQTVAVNSQPISDTVATEPLNQTQTIAAEPQSTVETPVEISISAPEPTPQLPKPLANSVPAPQQTPPVRAASWPAPAQPKSNNNEALPADLLEATGLRQSRRPVGPMSFYDWQRQQWQRYSPPGQVIYPAEADIMSEDLGSFIARVETSLISSAASGNNQPQPAPRRSYFQANPVTTPQQAIASAKHGLANFQQLVAAGQYDAARREWQQAYQLLWEAYPTAQPLLVQPELRTIWLDRGTIVRAGSEAGLAKVFDQLAASGINVVFFETLNAGYPIFPSQVAPEQNPLIRNWDPLASAVKLAKARNMELHAWVWVFASANQAHNELLRQRSDYLGPVLSRHPEWAGRDRNQNIWVKGSRKAFIDPANPQAREYLLRLYEEIVTRYDVDGLQLDYIRYPFQDPNQNITYGFGPAARQQFQAQFGIDPINLRVNDPRWTQWTQFRKSQVDSFVASVSQRLKQRRPQLVISAAVFPFQRSDRLDRLQQDWETWIDAETIDWLVPMSYSQDSEQLRDRTRPLFSHFSSGSTLLLPGIRLLNLPDVVAVDQVQFLRSLPTEGYALFAAANLNDNLGQKFGSTQGGPAQGPLPHREPFKAASTRYRLLRQEWQWLSQNPDYTGLNAAELQRWVQQSAALDKALTKLATQPTDGNLVRAQLGLSTFRREFEKWGDASGSSEPFQVESWNNRLETLSRLLKYGERTHLGARRSVVRR
ncbi:MAG: family 10 glycosylhydrolase [Cyanobacteria bacterium P01_H01_bin.15]